MKRWAGVLTFAFIWFIVLIVPDLRDLLRLQLKSDSSVILSLWPRSQEAASIFDQTSNSPEFADGSAVNDFPDDINVHFAAIPEPTNKDHTLKRLDRLIEKFPDNAWLIAARLRATMVWLRSERTGGELSDPNFEQNQAAGKPSPEISGERNFTPDDLNKAIALCRQGQKLEPDNAFFDWILAQLLLAGHRDTEAFETLARGGDKPRYDEHQLSDLQARVKARETVLRRPLLWEERIPMIFSLLLPQYARYREFARQFTWHGIKAQRRGDHQQALKIYGGLMKTHRRMREGSENYIQGLVAAAIETIAVSGPMRASRTKPTATGAARNQAYRQKFQEYAEQHGRDDLAREAVSGQQAGITLRAESMRYAASSSYLGVSFFDIARMGILWLVGIIFLILLIGSVLAWVGITALSRLRPVRLRISDQVHPTPVLSLRDRIGGVLACSGFTSFFYVVAVSILLLPTVALFYAVVDGEQVVKDFVIDLWSTLTAPFSPIRAASTTPAGEFWESIAFASMQSSTTSIYALWILSLVPFFVGVLYSAWAATRWQTSQQVPSDERPAEINYAGYTMALFRALLYFIACGIWIAVVMGSLNEELLTAIAATALAIFFWLISFGLAIGRWRSLPFRRAGAAYALRCHKRGLANFLVLGSFCYLLSLLCALPLRQAADSQINAVIEHGEVAALRLENPTN